LKFQKADASNYNNVAIYAKKPQLKAGAVRSLWKKESNLHGAVSSSAMCGGQPQSEPILVGTGITLCLSRIPTPETRGHVCQISSLHILNNLAGSFFFVSSGGIPSLM
jgi:hypothetical protein